MSQSTNRRRRRQPSKGERKRQRHEPTTVNSVILPSSNWLSDYTPPPPVASHTSSVLSASVTSGNSNKWFPKATSIPSSVRYSNDSDPQEARASLVLFYQYVDPPWTASRVAGLLAYLTQIAQFHRPNLGGRIRVGPEGINATVSAGSLPGSDGDSAARSVRHLSQDLKLFDPQAFAQTDFKFIDNLTPDRHFPQLTLMPVQELVYYGFPKHALLTSSPGTHLDASDFHHMLTDNDAVVIDVRNHYEAAIGRFEGQLQNHRGAQYIDPKMRKSTDFPMWLAQPDTQKQLQGKKVLMFCTGGIRCERASAYLHSQMGSNVQGVYQLQGGIEKYLQTFPDGGFWRGKNFVFDKREAISVGNFNGDGGVLRKGDKPDMDMSQVSWGAECAHCHRPWDRYIGKRKCFTCGVPVLLCDSCLTSKKKQNISPTSLKGKSVEENKAAIKQIQENVDGIRCPLCVEEGVTVPVDEVEYTDNGVRSKLQSSSFLKSGDSCQESMEQSQPPTNSKTNAKNISKAAKSVLKWGGGHAAKKKEKRQFSKIPCHFGVNCIRQDCFFYHSEIK